MAATKRYYTLAVRFEASDRYTAQSGDYNREVVAQERDDEYEEAYATKIISTQDDQQSIDAAIAKLNM